MSNEIQDPILESQDDAIIGLALKRSLAVLTVVAVAIGGGVAIWALMPAEDEVELVTEIALPEVRAVQSGGATKFTFLDITERSGVDWKHASGMEGEKLLPETMGGGIAIFDYDQDGDQDLLFVGGSSWPWAKQPGNDPRSLCLFANDGTGKFQDVTVESGLNAVLYAMGPAVADFDNDGWPDLFVTAVGKNRLFKNEQGRFTDVTETAGIAGSENAWSTGATWLDFDRDGLLDLFVCDYVVWARDLDLSLGFSLTGVGRAYGQPTSFTGTHSHLFRGSADGRFTEVSAEMGIEVTNPNTGVPAGKGLAVVALDVDHDGWQDLLVANDTVQNFLFLNNQGQGFEEVGVSMGIAFDRSGNATGAMGVDCGYLRNDDSLAIAIGNFANEQSSLYVSRGPEPPFFDEAVSSGLGPMSRLSLTFGMLFADLDLDSRQDVVCSNGHLEAEISKVQSTQQYAQPPQVFWNAGFSGASEFVALDASQVGEDILRPMVGRGAACADLDGDGDLDLVLVENSGPPRVLRNEQELGNRWLRVDLQGTGKSNRDALGAVVTVTSQAQVANSTGEAADSTADEAPVVQRRVMTSTRSYLSQPERVLTFGLGNARQPPEVRVLWPSGNEERFEVEVNVEQRLVEGTGVRLTD